MNCKQFYTMWLQDIKERRKELLDADGDVPDLVKRQEELKEKQSVSLNYYEARVNAIDGGQRAAKAAEEAAQKARVPKIYGPPR